VLTILAAKADTVAWPESLERLPLLLASPDHVLWVDFENATATENELLAKLFKFHYLAIEDAVGEQNHPKIDDYGDYVYVVIHGVGQAERRGELKTAELDCFLGRNFVVTYHGEGLHGIEETRKRCLTVPGVMARGADWLLHSLFDKLADTFLDIIEKLDEEIDSLERKLFKQTASSQRVLAEIFALKKDVLQLKRVVHPARDVYGRIARGEYRAVRAEVAPHFRDVYDHIVRVAEMLESFRDVVTSALETHLSVTAQRTNDVVKVLTVTSVIMMTGALIAGVYGMNFKSIPLAEHPQGFWIMLGGIAATSAVLLGLFKWRKYL
jgi:magnesium transporter